MHDLIELESGPQRRRNISIPGEDDERQEQIDKWKELSIWMGIPEYKGEPNLSAALAELIREGQIVEAGKAFDLYAALQEGQEIYIYIPNREKWEDD